MMENALVVKGETVDVYNKQLICLMGKGPD